MANLTAILDAAGATWADVVKTTIFLADIGDFAAVNAIYGRLPGRSAPGPLDGRRRRLAEGRKGRDRGHRPPAALSRRSVDTPNGAPIPCRHPSDDSPPTRAGPIPRRERPPSPDSRPDAPPLVNPPDTDATEVVAVVLAAGLGTRMRSALPKVLHPLCGRPMLAYVLDAWASTADGGAGPAPVVVYSPPVADVATAFADRADLRAPGRPARDR